MWVSDKRTKLATLVLLPTLYSHKFAVSLTGLRAPPMPGRRYVEEIGLAVMLVTKRSLGVAPEVNLKEHTCNTYAFAKCK